MPKGKRISLELREIICRNHIENNWSPVEIYLNIFNGQLERISLRYIRKICRAFRNVPEFRHLYLIGGRLSPGRPLSQGLFEKIMIRQHVMSNKSRRLCRMYRDYCEMFYPPAEEENNQQHILSLSTFKRTLKRGRLTRKVMERRNINQNPIEGLQFLDAIEHINPTYIIDIDETKQDRESRELKYGYSPEGENCIKDQIVINNTAYSTIAAVTSSGFLAWRIHEGNIDNESFSAFMVEDVAPHILPEHHMVLDNATIHHHPATRITLEGIFNGQYWYCARYSPHLKPIEPCFALVKEWIREHEDEAMIDPIGTINRGFEMYQIGGERADSVRGHWNGYFANYHGYLENNAGYV